MMTGVDGGTILSVRVIPRATQSKIDDVHDGALRVRLKAPPVDGAANKELCIFLAKVLGLPKRQVEVRTGERSRSKTVLIAGMQPAEVERALISRGS